MRIIDCEQGTKEWLMARLGIPTASGFDKIVTLKAEKSKQRDKYLYKLVGEKIINTPSESYTNDIMQRGKDLESEARLAYEFITGNEVKQVGFCISDDGKYGCSPDGLIGDDGLLEIKCPSLAVHVEYLLKNTLPSDYFQQVQGQLLVTGRKWVDFMSYYPGIRPLITRVYPDKAFLSLFARELGLLCDELERVYKILK